MMRAQPVYDFMTLDESAMPQKPGKPIYYYGDDAVELKPRRGIPGRVGVLGYPVDAQGRRIYRTGERAPDSIDETVTPGPSVVTTPGAPVVVAESSPLSGLTSNPILLIGIGLAAYLLLKGK